MVECPFNTLFLCTGNSARSIMAEAILNKLGAGQIPRLSARAASPRARSIRTPSRCCKGLGYDTSGFRSKSWSEFAKPGAPALDFVFTVCDDAAGETCPVWPGQPMTAHWGVPDPAEATGSDGRNRARVQGRLPDAASAHRHVCRAADPQSRHADAARKLKEIGRSEGATAKAAEPT